MEQLFILAVCLLAALSALAICSGFVSVTIEFAPQIDHWVRRKLQDRWVKKTLRRLQQKATLRHY